MKLFARVAGVVALLLATMTFPCLAQSVTGNPSVDGWIYGGNSLTLGVYVREAGNFGFDTYGTQITVTEGSNLAIADGAYSWLAGDTVLGLGGVFRAATAAENGWGVTLAGINARKDYQTKFVAKFGTAGTIAAPNTWSTSTVAPTAGNGIGSTANGGAGTVFVRSSGAQPAGTAGSLQLLGGSSYIDRVNAAGATGSTSVDYRAGRLFWLNNGTVGNNTSTAASWELLLNTSLLERLYPTSGLLTPGFGDGGIISVQQGTGAYTDALFVPEPSSVVALAAGLLSLLGLRRRRA